MRKRGSAAGWVLGIGLGVGLLGGVLRGGAAGFDRELAPAPGPADNPLKGLVPYAGQGRGFPCSLEFQYLSLRELMRGPTEFTWGPLERLLEAVSGRGRQAVFRVWLEYPRKPTGIPQYLLDGGLRVMTYTNTNTQPLPPARVTTPDYGDPRLREALTAFIRALGERYDGDPRIGFITAGLLGTWGEWHTHPRSDLWAGLEVQREVMDAYERSFRRTPVLLRYPAGPKTRGYADNATRRMGYHDDSFAWATRHTGRREDSWFFESRLREAGTAAMDKWRMCPIGGEIRPEAWTCVWDEPPCVPEGQAFLPCVEATHVTWVMDTGTFGDGAFGRKLTAAHRERAAAAVRRMGYELQVTRARLEEGRDGGAWRLRLSVTNHGVAPFYQAWAVELGTRTASGRVEAWPSGLDLRRSMPGEVIEWEVKIPPARVPVEPHRWLLRVVNPLAGGRLFRFANATQEAEEPGWLDLGAGPE